jgi:hypothetical protein
MSSSDINDDKQETSTPLHREGGHNLSNDGATSRPVRNVGANIYDTAYEGGRLRLDSPTALPSPSSSPDLDELEREAIELRDEAVRTNAEAQAEIALALAKPWHPDFPGSCIASADDGLHALLSERNRVEGDLMDMTHDRAADGTPLSPNRDYEEQLQLANDRYNQLNRAMYTSFANSLQAAANLAETRVGDLTRTKPTRKRGASDLIEPNQTPTAISDVCPYDHIRDRVPTTNTIPILGKINETLPEPDTQAWAPTRPQTPRFIPESPPIPDRELLQPHPDISYDLTNTRLQRRARNDNPNVEDQSASSDDTCFYGSMANHETVPNKSIYRSGPTGFAQPTWSAVPDSGASHILFKQSDSHVLQNRRYSKTHEAPFAVLKAANNAELTAIGKGTLSIAGLNLPAYIFRDHELATNLLGLVPFCDQGCTAVFKKNTFRLLWSNRRIPILTDTRRPGHSLWQV